MDMKKYFFTLATLAVLMLAGSCSDFLDRPQKSAMDDSNYWTNESNVRLFVNGAYDRYFTGYATSWSTAYVPYRGANFNDDMTGSNKQTSFQEAVPADNWYRAEGTYWLTQTGSSPWNFGWIRKWNTLIARLDQMKENGYLADEAYNHWMGVARLLRGFEYASLVNSFGDVPYYDKVVSDTDVEGQYKPRDPRTLVMDKVYDDFDFALNNIRLSDGSSYINRYVAGAMISRAMLFEGSWYTYHNVGDAERAAKYLNQAVAAAKLVMDSGLYNFTVDFRSLFGSFANPGGEVIMYREYSDALASRHCIASYSNLAESQGPAANAALLKSFISSNGEIWSESGDTNFDLSHLVADRDPRFEASFWHEANQSSATLLYTCKFIDRQGVLNYPGPYPSQYGSNTNTNGYPVYRLAEVVLNWLEAKAILAENYGGAAIQQTDLDASINAIRTRPLDEVAQSKGVQQTAPLQLNALPNDPNRDSDVSALMWEIRRERRMEFVFENFRLLDLRRWHKLDYMDGSKNPDLLLGAWVDLTKTEGDDILTSFSVLNEANIDKIRVQKLDGTVVTWNGSNAADMVGFYLPINVQNRDVVAAEKNYLAPICTDVINTYIDKGKSNPNIAPIVQNPGW